MALTRTTKAPAGSDREGSGAATRAPLELWGGPECTVNRVGDLFYDQTVRTGHQDRIEDLDLFAGLGLKALRYPVLWERIAPNRPDARDWRWSDARLNRIRALGLRPIAGLTHHGSGPRYTHLLDPEFAAGLAQHARAVAERYPWLDAYTPVNEPLTTARFSALYGHWYPHARDEAAFYQALLNQIDAVRLAMRAVRQVNPAAQLIQTEDFGFTFCTPPVQQQADHDNTRRWLTWDLLTGRVTPEHPMFARIAGFGLEDQLRAIAEDPCPPDVIGVNHYLTSERLLDHRTEAYPLSRRGGNGWQAFADVEAVRAVMPGVQGWERLLEQVWDRYRLPLAVTECHVSCTREEQVRWLAECWDAAEALRARGVPVRAVTAWSLLGAFDWNRLLTTDAGYYESGVFDVSAGRPRPTQLAEACRRLARGESVAELPGAAGPGWWTRDLRLEYAPVWRRDQVPVRRRWRAEATQRPLLITGATGTLGQAIARACEHRGLAYVLTDRASLPLDDPEAARRVLGELRPWAVANATGWVRVDEAEHARDGCLAANAAAVAHLAAACCDVDAALLTFSSDLVFDGSATRPYVERDAPRPLNVYGESKALAEAEALRSGARALVVRTAAFFQPYDPHNFAHHLVRALRRGERFEAANDLIVSPTYVPDLVNHSLDLLLDGETGLRHLANVGAVSWAEFGIRLAEAVGLDARRVIGRPHARFGWAAARPAYAALGTERGQLMPALDDAIARWAEVMREGLSDLPAVKAPSPEVIDLKTARSFAPSRRRASARVLDA